MTADMLKSQFDTLEKPKNAFVIDISDAPEAITKKILNLHEDLQYDYEVMMNDL